MPNEYYRRELLAITFMYFLGACNASANEAPVLDFIYDQAVGQMVGGPVTISISASDPDGGDTLAFQQSGMPSFCSFQQLNNVSAEFNCEWSEGDPMDPGDDDPSGIFPTTVTVTDNGAPVLNDDQIFNIFSIEFLYCFMS